MTVQTDINANKKLYCTERIWPEKDRSRNSPEHELVKNLVVWQLQKSKYQVYTEVALVGGGIADIFVPEIPAYFEILHTETDAMLKKKCEKYPKGLTQVVIRVSDVIPKGASISEMVKNLKEILP